MTDKTKKKTFATLETGDPIFYGQRLYIVSSVIEGCGQIKITAQSYNDDYTIPSICFVPVNHRNASSAVVNQQWLCLDKRVWRRKQMANVEKCCRDFDSVIWKKENQSV